MTVPGPRVLLTGAAGKVGTVLRRGLGPHCALLRVADVAPLVPEADNEDCLRLDLRDAEATVAAARDIDVVVHLGAVPTEAGFDELVDTNVHGTHHVFEACRRNSVRRLVFASSNHATGFYPRDTRLDGTVLPRPDGYYGVTKVFGEALGRLYHDKFGLEVVCVRIGSFTDTPTDRRMLSTWLSPRDGVTLFRRCIEAPRVGFVVVYGVSANTRGWWDHDDAATALGYVPRDDAEAYAADLDRPAADAEAGRGAAFQGGPFVDVHGTAPTATTPHRSEEST